MKKIEIKYKYYHYCDQYGIIRIKSKRRPSLTTRPKYGTWTVQEFKNENWIMPCFPQITLKTIETLVYLGCINEKL